MKKQAALQTSEFRVYPLDDHHVDPDTIARELSEIGAAGWGVATVIQAYGSNPPLLIFGRGTGVVLVDVEVPEQSQIAPVAIGPANGGGPPKGFRGFRG